MLSGAQKGVMSDAMLAVTQSPYTNSVFRALTDPLSSSIGDLTGMETLDPGTVRVLYVQIFAKGDAADATDFKKFMTAAKVVSDTGLWSDYRLDARWAALPTTEQGPSEVAIAAENTGMAKVLDSISSGLSSAGSSLVIFALIALAVVVLIVKKT
jgi:hypothetical protein